jgi:hypothetical protein
MNTVCCKRRSLADDPVASLIHELGNKAADAPASLEDGDDEHHVDQVGHGFHSLTDWACSHSQSTTTHAWHLHGPTLRNPS